MVSVSVWLGLSLLVGLACFFFCINVLACWSCCFFFWFQTMEQTRFIVYYLWFVLCVSSMYVYVSVLLV